MSEVIKKLKKVSGIQISDNLDFDLSNGANIFVESIYIQ